jgi:hypothetical protein
MCQACVSEQITPQNFLLDPDNQLQSIFHEDDDDDDEF